MSVVTNSQGIIDNSTVVDSLNTLNDTTFLQNTVKLINDQVVPKYSMNTNVAMLMNDSYNNAEYMAKDLQVKKQDAYTINEKTKTGVHKVRFTFLQKRHQAAYNRFISSVIQATIIVISITAIIASMYKLERLPPRFVGVSIFVLIALFLLVLAVIIKNNMTRRTDDWNKFYWQPNVPNKVYM